MADIWGSVDNDDLRRLVESLEAVGQDADGIMQAFFEQCAKALAARLLELVIPRTPVADDNGGTLRRGWISKTEGEAYVNRSKAPSAEEALTWAMSLKVEKMGGSYRIEVINPVYYAPYVEFGHRTNVKGGHFGAKRAGKTLWVEGQYFLTTSENDLKSVAPQVIEKEIEKFLKKQFG